MVTTLRLAHIVEKTRSEGPGVRTAIWVQGCTIRCPGCCNPELFSRRGGRDTPIGEVVARCDGVEGITVVGGEPFEQPEGLAALDAVRLPEFAVTRLVFSGLPDRGAARARDCSTHQLRPRHGIDVLVDGRYDGSSKPDDTRQVRRLQEPADSLSCPTGTARMTSGAHATMELRYKDGKLVVVGWPAWR